MVFSISHLINVLANKSIVTSGFTSHSVLVVISSLLYMAKHLRGNTFAFKVENGYLLENYYNSMPVDLYCQSARP